MRTTVRLPDDLMRAVRRHAAESGRTLTAIIEDALRATLARDLGTADTTGESIDIDLPTYGIGGIFPGVDLDDSAALADLMDRSDDLE